MAGYTSLLAGGSTGQFSSTNAAIAYFLKADPELLERRMKFQEKEQEQRTVILLGTAVFIAGFLSIAIDLRLNDLNQVHPLLYSRLMLVCSLAAVIFSGFLRRIAMRLAQLR